MSNPVNWFEIPVTDMERAKKFYETILDYEITINDLGDIVMGWFPFKSGSSGATGSLILNENYSPSHDGSLVYFSVPEIDDVTAKITNAGGKVLKPKYAIGEHGFSAIFEDTEGNRVALYQGVNS